MAEQIKAINSTMTIQPLASPVGNRDTPAPANALASVPAGTILSGFVVNRDASNNPILRTDQGDLLVQSDVFIKTGSEVVFRVDPTQASRAQILTIDELTPDLYTAQSTRGLTQDTIAQSSLQGMAPQPAVAQAAGQTLPVLEAVVLQATVEAEATSGAPSSALPFSELLTTTPGTATIPSALAQLAPGTPLALTVLDIRLPPLPVAVSSIPESAEVEALLSPPSAGATTPSSTAASAASSALPPTISASRAVPTNAQNASPAAASPASNAVPPGSSTPPATPTATAPVAANLPAAIPSATATAPFATASAPAANQVTAQPTALQATVIGHGEDGSNILNTSFATLKLFTTQPLPTGTVLDINAEALPALNNTLANFIDLSPRGVPDTNFGYLSQLMQSDPTAMQTLLAQLPVVGPKLTSGLLFYLAAVKGGKVADLFSPRAASRLDELMPDLLTKLGKDIETLHQEFTNSPLTDWKAVQLPLIFGNEAQSAKLFIRQDEGGSSTANAAITGQRFLIDVRFSELGDVQFDGFMRNEAKSLELCLRSVEPLDAGFGANIRQIFDNALQTTGLTGQIQFQHGAERFVRPQPKPPAGAQGPLAQTILA